MDEDDAVAVGFVVAVGVGVSFTGLAVGGPAGVGDAERAVESLVLLEHLLEDAHPADRPGDMNVRIHHRQARRVIPAIFQPFQSF